MPLISKQSPVAKKPGKAQGGVLSRIRSIGFDDDLGIKILLYGRSGTGKTTLWATFPAPILAIVCSGGLEPGELLSVDTPENRKRIKQVALQDTDELNTVIEAVKSGELEFNTLVLDHASGFQDLVMAEILGLEPGALPPQKSWGMASQQQYGQCALRCKTAFRALLSLPSNVVIIAQERNFNDEGAGSELLTPTVGAALQPSITGWLNPACDYVCQTFIRPRMEATETKVAGKTITGTKRGRGVEYCLRTEPHEIFTTKFRTPRGTPLPDCIVDPTYDKIVRLIRGGKKP